MIVRRLLCAVFGHRPGADVFRYAPLPKVVGQWPHRRGPTRLEALGRECERCRRPIEGARA